MQKSILLFAIFSLFCCEIFAQPSASVTPSSLSATINSCNDSVTQTLTVNNTGDADLNYNVLAPWLPLDSVLARINQNYTQITNEVPQIYFFTEGDIGNNISDGGGDDMYDGGNYLNTDLGINLAYSDNSIISSAAMGANGKYFTIKNPGLFVFAADVNALNYFEITGNLGADGSGLADTSRVTTTRFGKNYTGFIKRVYSAGDPSVNHLIIIESDTAVSHTYSTDTDNDQHRLTGISNVTRIYYLLYAGSGGAYIDDASTFEIFNKFLEVIIPEPYEWMTFSPISGTIATSGSENISVKFKSEFLETGVYNFSIYVVSDDPINDTITVPATLTVNGTPEINLSDICLDYDSVLANGTYRDTVFIYNSGCDTLFLTNVNITGDAEFVIDTFTAEIAPFEDGGVVVNFVPTASGNYSGTLNIQNNDADTSLCLAGVALPPPIINFNPSVFNVSASCGDSLIDTLTVSNSGSADLTFSVSPCNLNASLQFVLDKLNQNFTIINSAIPSRYDFSDGVIGDNISDGGNDMYDGGNYINTNLGSFLSYSDNTIINSAAMGTGGKYFTRKYQGLWVFAADINSVSSFQITGGLGADGSGSADATELTSTLCGKTFRGFVKRVFNAGDPSVNHLIIVEDNGGLSQNYFFDTDNDYHQVSGLNSSTRIYYLLYASAAGGYINDSQTLNIFSNFLDAINSFPEWLVMQQPFADTLANGESVDISVEFDAIGLNAGQYSDTIFISSNDPSNPTVAIPCMINVDGEPEMNFVNVPVYLGDPILPVDSLLIGENNTDTFYIKNSGCDTLKISDINKTLAVYSVSDTAFNIMPGDSMMVTVTFTPPSPSDYYDSLIIYNNQNTDTVIYLFDVGLPPPIISFTPDTFNVTLSCGDSLIDTLTIYNTGFSPLTFQIDGAGNGSTLLNVAIVAAENTASYRTDVQTKLMATGKFNLVDIYSANTLTPTLAQLQQYDAVLVWSNTGFSNATTLGNNLADYIDGGGGVVAAVFTTASVPLAGRFNTDDYWCIDPSGQTSGAATLGTVYDAGHPIMNGVASFNGGISWRTSTFAINPAAIRIADWSDGRPLVATRIKNGAFRVDLGMFPPSSDSYGSGWLPSTDGALLMANALVWSVDGGGIQWLSINPEADTVPAQDSLKIVMQFNSSGLNVGVYTGNVIVSSNDPLSSSDTIPVILNVTGTAELSLTKNCMYLDSIMEFTTKTDSLYVKNTGCDTMFITNVTGQTGEFLFAFSGDTLMPGDSVKLTVSFAPTSTGDFFDTLTVFSNVGDSLICLSGKGFPRPEISVDPPLFNVTLACADTLTDTLTIHNIGLTPLIYNIDTGNYALSLDGSGDYVNRSSVNLPTATSQLTIEAWIYPVAYSDATYNGIVSWGARGCTGNGIVLSIQNNGRPSMATWCNDFIPSTGAAATLNQWNHIALVRNGTSVTLYMNGTPVSGTLSSNVFYGSQNLALGCTDYPGRYFNGKIDEVRVWNVARSTAEILATMNSKLYGMEPGLVSYWNFDKQNANDKTATGNNGTLNGNAAITYNTAPFTSYYDLQGALSGTINTGDSTQIPVTFISTGLTVGTYQDSIVITCNDPLGNPTIVPATLNVIGSPKMEFPQNCLYLDSIMEFTTNSDTFYIKNTGCDSLFISNITKQTANFSVTPLQDTILVLDSAAFVVTFSPTSVGDFFDTLTIFSNAGDSLFCLSGKAFGKPIISFNPDTFNITISCGDTFVDTLKIYNSGASDLIYSLSPQGLGATGTITYFETFTNGQTPTGAQSTGWANYRSQLLATLPYTQLRFYGSNNPTGVTITDVTAITSIANALRTSGSMNVTTQGNTWYVGNCGGGPALSVNTTVCNCDGANPSFYVIRPQIGNDNWGGVNTSTCFGPTQSITVEFTFGTPFMSLNQSADTVIPNDSSAVEVTFNGAGLNAGTYNGIIAISSNDPSSPNDTIPVILNVTGFAELTFTEDSLYLDSIMEFTSSTDSAYIKNTGCDTLFISNITTQTTDFTFILASDTILPGDSAKLEITFTPASPGDFFDTLTVFSNAGDSLFELSGKAFDRPIQTHYPDTINVTLACADTLSDTLKIFNTGLSDLLFNFIPTDTTGNSVSLDGSNDYVNLGAWSAGTQWTIEAWVRPSSTPSGRRTIAGGMNACFDWGIVMENGVFGVGIRPGACSQTISSGVAAQIGKWYHIVGTNDGTTAKIYVNGELKNSGTVAANYTGTASGTRIGGEFCCGGNNFPGLVDEVRIWNTPLPQAQINAYMFSRLSGSESNLVGYWNFDDGTANDLSSFGRNGILTSGAFITTPNVPLLPDWLFLDSFADTVVSADSAQIAVTIISTGLTIGQYVSNITVNSNDPLNLVDTATFVLNVIGAPEMEFPQNCLYLDSIMEFTSNTDTFYIKNTGCDTLFITNITSQTTQFAVTPLMDTILVLDSSMFIVTFSPDSAGDFFDTLTVFSNAGDSLLCLSGKAFDRPIISFNPDTIEVTAVCADTLLDTLTIYNTGLSDLFFSTSSTGMSALFDGVNDYMSTTLNTDQGGSTPLTLEAWVYPTSNSAGRHQVISSNNGGFDWSILREAGTWFVFTGSGSTNTGFSVDLNQWQHIAAVFIPGTGVKFYKNGVEFSTATISFDASDGNINIGRTPSNTEFFEGRIDEARVWDIQRSQTDIISTMNKKLYGDETGLSGYWHFDDGTTNDFSGNGFNGTLNNGASVSIPNAPVSEAWLTYSAVVSDTVAPADSSQIGFQFVSTGLTVGQYVSAIQINSNDPLNSVDTAVVVLNVIGAPQMVLSDSCISFDTIMEFTNVADTFFISNTGCDTLWVSAQTSLNFFIDSLSIDSAGGFILPGDTADILILFAPDSVGNFTGTLTLNTNDYDTVICLNGYAYPRPIFSFTPDSIDITITECCDSVVVPLTVYNTGGSDLTFTITTTGGFFDDIENGQGGWAQTGLWHTETTQSFSPTTSWTYNTGNPNYNFNTGTNSGSLTSEIIDLTSVAPSSTTTLTFNCFYNTESGTTYDQRWIQVSVNGGAFTNFIQLSGETMSSWHSHSFDFSSFNGNSIRLRYFFNSIDGSFNNGWGWSVDDVSVVNNSASCNAFACFAPQTDTTAAGDSSFVNITFNSCNVSNGSYSANLYIYSNDPFAPVDTVFLSFTKAGLPELYVSDSCLYFDTIVEFTTQIDSVMLKNTGCDTLFVSAQTSLNFLLEDDTLFVDSVGGYLLPGDSGFINVLFAPDSAGSFTGILTINSNDIDTVICLNGFANPRPILSVVPDTINAYISDCQDSAFATFIVSNTGGSDLFWNTSVNPPAPLNVILNPSADTTAMSGSTVVNVSLSDNSLPFGNNLFEIIVNSNDPLNSSDTVVINLYIDSLPPVAPVVNDTAICFGQITPDLIAFGDSIRWYDDAALTNMVFSGDTFATGEVAVGVYTYYVTNTDTVSNCESLSDTVTLSINTAPSQPSATDTIVCSDATIPQLSATGTILKWYSDGALTNLVFTGNPFNSGDILPGTYTYYVTDSAGGCPSSPADTVVLIINNAATVDAGAAIDSICEGSDYTVSGTMGGGTSTILWTTDGDGTFDDNTSVNAVYTPGATDISNGSVTLTITTDDPDGVGPCTAVFDDLVLVIMPVASVDAGADDVICSTSNYPLSGSFAGGASSITWTSSGTGSFNDDNSINAIYTPSPSDISAGTVTLIITTDDPDGPCSSVTDSMVLTINSAATVSANVDDTICSGMDYTLNGSRGGGASVSLWTTSGDGTFDNASLLNAVYTPGANDISNGTVTLTITTDDPAGPCNAVVDDMIIIINQTPAAPVTSDTTVCSDATIPNLTASGTNIQWYSDVALTNLAGTGNSFATGQTAPGAYTYYATDSLTNCPAGAASSATLTINEGATVSAGANDTICEGNNYALNGTMGGSASAIQWTTSGDGNFDYDTALAAVYTPGANDISNGTVTLTITTDDPDGAGACVPADSSMILTINPAATVNAGSDTLICETSSYVLSGAVGGGGTSVTWTTSGDGIFNNANLPAATYAPGASDISNGSATLYITSNDPAGPCPAIADSMVLAINSVATVIAGTDSVICAGNDVTLSGAMGGSASSVLWTTSGDGSFDDATLLTALYTPGATDISNGTVTLTIATDDPAGPCTAVADSMVLTINSAPSTPVVSDTAICFGQNVPDLPATGTILQWYDDAGLTNLVFTGNPFSTGDSAAGTFTYYVTDSLPFCPVSSAASVTLTINALPSAPVAADTAICFSEPTPDLVVTGDSIRWYDDALLANMVFSGNNFSTGETAAGVYTYYATQTDLVSGCEGLADTVTLTINAIPTAPASSDTAICFGETTPALVAIGTNVQWYDDATLTNLVFTGDTFSTGNSSAGTYTYYATQTINNCESPSTTTVLTINAIPAAPASSDTAICEGNPTPDLVASGTNVQWYDDAGLTNLVGTGNNFASGETASGTDTYYATETVNNCESPATIVVLTILAIPGAPVASDTAVCFGNPVPDLTASGTNLKWYDNVALTNQVGTGNTFTTNQTAIGTYTYYVTDSLNSCGQGPSTAVTLTIDTLPTAPSSTDAAACSGDAVPPLSASGTNLNWYDDAALTNLVFTGDTFATGNSAVGTYTYYVTNFSAGCGESSADSTMLTIYALPSAPVTADGNNCFGSATDSLFASGAGIVWYSDAGLTTQVSTENSFTPADLAVGTYIYYATQTDSATGCVSAADSAMLTIYALPAAPTASDTTVLYGNPVPDLTASGTNIQWYSDSSLTVLVGSGNNFASGDTAVGSYTYYATQISAEGCEGDSVAVTLTILPAAPLTVGATSCEGDSVPSLTASGNNIQWYSDAGLTAMVFAGDSFASGDSVAGTYTYYATQTVNGFESPAMSATLTINALPAVPAVMNDTSVCASDVIPVLVASGTNINWYSDAGLTTLIATGDSLNTGQTSAGTYSYYATQTVLGCEGAASAVTLTIIANPSAPLAADSSTCFGGTVPDLFASGTNVLWYSDSALTTFVFAGNTFSTGETASGVYTYYTIDTLNGCASPYTVVNLLISAPSNAPDSANASSSAICPGEAVTLSVSGTLSTGTLWRWYSASCGGTVEGSGDSIVVSPLATTTYFVRAEGGCDTSACVSVVVNVTNTLSIAASGSVSDVDSVCPNATVNLNMNGGSLGTGANWNWYESSCSGTSIGTGTSVAVNPAVTTTYFVRAEGTCNTTVCDSVTVNVDVPAAPLSNDETICEGQTVPNLVASGTNVNWYSDAGLTVLVGSGSSFATGETAIGTYTYYTTQTVNSCASAGTAVTLNIIAAPATPVANDAGVCVGSNVPPLTSSAGNNIQWYDDAALTNVVNAGTTFNTGQTAVGVYTYYVSDSLPGCVSNADTVILTINAIPSAPAASNITVCFGSVIPNLVATGSNVQWYSESMLILSAGSGNGITPAETQVGNYDYYATQTVNGCTSSATMVMLNINPNPLVTLNTYSTNISAGQSVTLIAYNAGIYNWTPSTGLNITTNDTVIATPDSTITYTVTGSNAFGCSSNASVVVEVWPVDVEELGVGSSEFAVYPNPNRGEFVVQITDLNRFADYELQIYNMLGEIIYEKRNCTNIRNMEIDLGKRGSGVYYVQVVGEKGVVTKKVIIE